MQRTDKKSTVFLETMPTISSFSSVVGTKEGDGPLKEHFDYIVEDVRMGQDSWEKSESELQEYAYSIALSKGYLDDKDISYVFAGDLMNQCTSSAYSMRSKEASYIGMYGACSTMAETLAMAGIFIDSGIGRHNLALTSSHFCSAERTFRFPVNYGGQRTPTSQWTATASGCAIVSPHSRAPYIRAVTFGRIQDKGVTDANNMGAAMAFACYDTITRHLKNTNQTINDFDMIISGDLGQVGSDMLYEMFEADGIGIARKHSDCGLMLYDRERQDVHAGGSGCGCSASVLCGYFLKKVRDGEMKKILFTATGALMSTTLVQQGESIPSIAHSVEIVGES